MVLSSKKCSRGFTFFLTLFSLPLVTRENCSTDKSSVTKPNLKQIQVGKTTSWVANGKLWLYLFLT